MIMSQAVIDAAKKWIEARDEYEVTKARLSMAQREAECAAITMESAASALLSVSSSSEVAFAAILEAERRT